MSISSEISRIAGSKQDLSDFLESIGEATGTEKIETLIAKAISIMSSYGDRISALEASQPIKGSEGNWNYRVYPDDGTIEAFYGADRQTVTIVSGSGSLFRSERLTLSLPPTLTAYGTIEIKDAMVNVGHNNYPCWGVLASIAGAEVNYYAMSGGSRSQTSNYTITAQVFGRIITSG